jgi:hypothetical protein
MLPELSEALRPPPPGITPLGLKLTAGAGRFEREGGSSDPNIFRKSATACCPVAFRPSPFRIGCYRPIAAKSISCGVTFFPAGMLPSLQVLKSLGERCSVPVIRERIFGQDYAKTRASWRNNFRATSPHLMPSGFDDRFRRLSGILPRLLPGEIPVGKYRGAPGGVRKVESHNRVQNRLSLLPRAL